MNNNDNKNSSEFIGFLKDTDTDKPFICLWENCGKQFTKKSDLIRHVRIHNNERLYKCELCDKSFIQNSALTIHTRIHTNDRPYTCTYLNCDKAFYDSSGLTRHLRSHEGIKMYKCEKCPKAFTRKSTLIRHHQVTHTQEEQSDPQEGTEGTKGTEGTEGTEGTKGTEGKVGVTK
jgi:uncharacterized Zn-finger protein